MAEIFQRACDLGLTTSLDTNWDPEESWNSGLKQLLEWTDVLFPNEQEALLISHTQTLDEAISWLRKAGVHLIAVKRGERGALVTSKGQRFTCALPAVIGGDSIGAGDSFDAGFLAAWLREFPLENCLQVACHCGREVAAQVGGLRGQPSWKKIQHLAGIS
jgi:sugar/nucleoside kinase (ribokinase family)